MAFLISIIKIILFYVRYRLNFRAGYSYQQRKGWFVQAPVASHCQIIKESGVAQSAVQSDEISSCFSDRFYPTVCLSGLIS